MSRGTWLVVSYTLASQFSYQLIKERIRLEIIELPQKVPCTLPRASSQIQAYEL